jgi:hypothetical protein
MEEKHRLHPGKRSFGKNYFAFLKNKPMKKLLLFIVLLVLSLPGIAQTGLHYTPAEVAIWKQRAVSGPYRVKGDAQANSPGDWARISDNANKFLANPLAELYSKTVYKGNGCVPNANQGSGYADTQNPATTAEKMRDAGFYYLITGDAKYANAVRSAIMADANSPLLDFTNTSRWCPGNINDIAPGFIISEWLTRSLYAYDYIKAFLSDADKSKLNAWFLGAATYMRSNLDPNLDGIYVNRSAGDYTLSKSALKSESGAGSLMYFGGPKARWVSRQYNNRRASMAALIGIVGVFLNDNTLKASGKRFFKETIMVSIYPTGYFVDFLRGVDNADNNPEKGYSYSTQGTLFMLADALARSGDTELYEWAKVDGTTSATSGVDASSDGKTIKGLKMHIKAMLDLRNHKKVIYATAKTANVGKEYYIVDGITPGGNYSVWDIMYAVPNLYYKDKYILDSYTRKADGAIPYPVKAQTSGASPAWGTLGQYPGILFMFGQMEGKVWPFKPVVPPVPGGPQVVSYTLINADTQKDIKTLSTGETITLSALGLKRLAIRANTSPAKVGSVVMTFSGPNTVRNATENGSPYALFGDSNGQLIPGYRWLASTA